ncbi:MAG TPA: rhodanese-like domain-containing protein, partial [Bacillota bacterium]|nr:rhodanese-like domain-containing protein [Bacillota bacterium]
MRLIAKKLTLTLLLVLLAVSVSACNPSDYVETESQIISASDFAELLVGDEEFYIIDMQKPEDYKKGHVEGAVNVVKDDIVISVPVDNMLTSKAKFEKAMSEAGIEEDTTVYIYDNDRMSAARLWWSFLMYGNENAKVIDGGISAIEMAGIELTNQAPTIKESQYKAGDKSDLYIATMGDVKDQIDEPNPNMILLDVRTDQEYIEKGKIPSSIMMDYANVFYADNTFKSVQTIRIDFIDNGMRPENEIIMYCQTSMRAAPVFLSLYNAGYRNIKIYDGAYLEWSSNPNNPVEIPEGTAVLPSKK